MRHLSSNLSSKSRFLVAGMVLVGAVLRFFHLAAKGLGADEITTYIQASKPLANIFLRPLTLVDPPFHPALIKGLKELFGTTEWLMRLPSAVGGVIALPLIYWVVWELQSMDIDRSASNGGKNPQWNTVALIALLLLSISPFHVHLSQESRAFPLLIAFALASTWLFLRFLRTGRTGWLGWYIVVSTIGFYFHCLIAFIFISNNLFLVIYFRKYQRLWKRWFVSQTLHFILVLPYFYVTLTGFYLYVSQSLGWELEKPRSLFENVWTVGTILLHYAHGGTLNLGWSVSQVTENAYLMRFLIKLPFLLVFVPLLVMGLVRSRPQTEWGTFLWLWFACPFVLVFMMSFKINWLMDRHLVTAYPAFLILLALGLEGLRRTEWSAALVTVVAILCGASLANYYFNPEYRGEPWREVAEYVDSQVRPDDAVLLHAPHVKVYFDFYKRGNYETTGLGYPTGGAQEALAKIGELTSGKKRLWLIFSHNQQSENFYTNLLRTRVPLLEQVDYPKLRLFCYRLNKGTT